MANCAAYSGHILWRDWKFAARPCCRLSWRPPCLSDKDCLDSENPASHAAAAFGKCELDAQKRRRSARPSFWTAYIPVTCLPVRSPRNHRGAMGCTPSAWEVLSRPCPLDTSRTPYRTSGLPAGAEPSLESKDIIASTNPECPDTFENNRTTQLHRCTATELQSYMTTHREEYDDYFAVQTFGAITPGAL